MPNGMGSANRVGQGGPEPYSSPGRADYYELNAIGKGGGKRGGKAWGGEGRWTSWTRWGGVSKCLPIPWHNSMLEVRDGAQGEHVPCKSRAFPKRREKGEGWVRRKRGRTESMMGRASMGRNRARGKGGLQGGGGAPGMRAHCGVQGHKQTDCRESDEVMRKRRAGGANALGKDEQ